MDNKTLKKYQDKGIIILDPRNTYIGPGVEIAKGNIIYPNTFLISNAKKGSKKGKIKIGPKNVLGPNLHLEGSVSIGSRNNISYSHITDTKIGNENTIGPYARVRDGVTIANNVKIGNFVEVKNSTIGNGTQVAHLSYIGDADLGRNVNVGAGTITANYNSVTGKKSRTKIKNGASTGSNSVLVAPVTIGENSLIAAGSVITKNVPAKALGIARGKQENKLGYRKN